MGRQNVRDNLIHVKQLKTGWEGDVPIAHEPAAALGSRSALTTSFGEPYTAASFGNVSV